VSVRRLTPYLEVAELRRRETLFSSIPQNVEKEKEKESEKKHRHNPVMMESQQFGFPRVSPK